MDKVDINCLSITQAIASFRKLNNLLKSNISSDVKLAMEYKKQIESSPFWEIIPIFKDMAKYENKIEEMTSSENKIIAQLIITELKTKLGMDSTTCYKKAEEFATDHGKKSMVPQHEFKIIAQSLIRNNKIEHAQKVIELMNNPSDIVLSEIIDSFIAVKRYDLVELYTLRLSNNSNYYIYNDLNLINNKYKNGDLPGLSLESLGNLVKGLTVKFTSPTCLEDVVYETFKTMYSLGSEKDILNIIKTLPPPIKEEAYRGICVKLFETGKKDLAMKVLNNIKDNNTNIKVRLIMAKMDLLENNNSEIFDLLMTKETSDLSHIVALCRIAIKCNYLTYLDELVDKLSFNSFVVAKLWTEAGLQYKSEEYFSKAVKSLEHITPSASQSELPAAYYEIASAKAKCGLDYSKEASLAHVALDNLYRDDPNTDDYSKNNMLVREIDCFANSIGEIKDTNET